MSEHCQNLCGESTTTAATVVVVAADERDNGVVNGEKVLPTDTYIIHRSV